MAVQSRSGTEFRRELATTITALNGVTFGSNLLLEYQRPYQLIEEHGYPVDQLLVGRLRIGPAANHDATTIYQDRAIRREEIKQHCPYYFNPIGPSVRHRTVYV